MALAGLAQDGPTFLNIRKYMDSPQALALAMPHPIKLYVKDAAEAKAWIWPLELQKALGKETIQVRTVGRVIDSFIRLIHH